MPQHDFELKPLWGNIIWSMKIDVCKWHKIWYNSLLYKSEPDSQTILPNYVIKNFIW